MVDLAIEAFGTKNFDLAIDVFERTIKDRGPSSTLCIGLADSYAKTKQLAKALDAYRVAFRLGTIRPDQLGHLVELMVGVMTDSTDFAKLVQCEHDLFSCGICTGLWKEPCTLHCGHTFCRACLTKENMKMCKQCGATCNSSQQEHLGTNVVLQNIVETWFSVETEASKLKDKGNELFQKHQLQEAIEVYSQAMLLCPGDHLLAGNRSLVYASLEQFPEALQDAELAVKLCPVWPKGHFRRGTALLAVGRFEEAAFALLQCLALDPTVDAACGALKKALHKLLSPLQQPEDLKESQYHSLLHPNTLSHLLHQSTSHLSTSQQSTSLQSPTHDPCPIPSTSRGTGSAMFSERGLRQLEQCLANNFVRAGCAENVEPHFQTHVPHGKREEVTGLSSSSPILQKRGSSDTTPVPGESKLARRHSSETPQTTSSKQPSTVAEKKTRRRSVAKELLRPDLFECTLCYRMLFQPVTTPCGHTYCRQCLDRCLDHNPICPLCKSSLAQYLAERDRHITWAVEDVIAEYYPDQFRERQLQFEEEVAEMTKMAQSEQRNVPIFVCTLAFPTVACPLHIFEPRYRLMVRRCMESGLRQFGMCINLEEGGDSYTNFGTLLEIEDVQYLPDGRSVVNTVGTRPFKVLSRDHKDGYHTAQVQLLKDVDITDSKEKSELQALNSTVHQEVRDWLSSLPQVPKQKIQQHFGTMPGPEDEPAGRVNGPAWAWWTLAVLPLDNRAKLTVLAMTSFRDRLQAIRRVVQFSQRRGQH